MEAIVAWFICIALQFLQLCNCYPITSFRDGSQENVDLGTVLFSFFTISTILTLCVVIIGCTWCNRLFKKDSGVSQSIQLGDTSTSDVVDPGILNPLNDIRFPITTPLDRHSVPVRGYDPQQQNNIHPYFYQDQQDVDNNNGPISPQELENIVNNNAENYIVSEYENREVVVQAQDADIPSAPHSSNSTPPHDVHLQYSHWFDNIEDEVPRTQLQYLQVIGKGWFGRIVEGEILESGVHNRNVSKVAVKILDENVSVREKCKFLQESQILRNATHENILKFMGKNLSQEPWFLLLEYCSLGDLKQYLRANRYQMQLLNDQGFPLKIILEISSALNYLHQNNVLFDVACHNCLVSNNLSARLGDYGDADLKYPEHFYSVQDNSPVPLRWLPPEYFTQHMITHSSNVWSLGVFMWECCSWGEFPYSHLTNEQVMREIMCQSGLKLQQPVPNTLYTSYLYNVMLSCWNDEPSLRCDTQQVCEYIQSLNANFLNSVNNLDESFAQFNTRWESLKPNTIPKVDNSLPNKLVQVETGLVVEADIRIIHPSGELLGPGTTSVASSETTSVDDIMLNTKSDSLTNLHGSFESVSNRHVDFSDAFPSALRNNGTHVPDVSHDMVPNTNVEKTLLSSSVSKVAPWLLDVPLKTPEDISYIKNVSDVINDFDNMLSSEKTSSSESSPSRDVGTHTSGIGCERGSSQFMLSEYDGDKVSLTDCVSENNSSCKECQSQESAYETNVISENVNNSSNSVPQVNKIDIKDIYPTLDFRLMSLDEEESSMDQILKSNTDINIQQVDSLQDSSYIPECKSDKESSSLNRSSSGSETEDEVWKKRVELGVITEKIKLKSKSATDFMVLTHIDIDYTDLESADTSYNSLEGKANIFLDMIQKKRKRNSVEKTNHSLEEYSSSLINQFVSIKPDFDLYKAWKSCKHMTIRNLRPSKSLSDLDKVLMKCEPLEVLRNFKKVMDSSLKNCNYSNNDTVLVNWSENRYFDHSGAYTTTNQLQDISNPIFSNNLLFDNYDICTEEEHLKFSSNFNDINLNLYSESSKKGENTLWDSTKYMSLPEQFEFEENSSKQVPENSLTEIEAKPYESFTLEDNLIEHSTPNLNDHRKQMVIPYISVNHVSENVPMPIVENVNAFVEQQIDEIIRSEVLNITTKLAIAENENNLNIEISTPDTVEESLQGISNTESNSHNLVNHNGNITQNENEHDVGMFASTSNITTNKLIQDLDTELQKLDSECEIAETDYFSPETSESLYENVDPNTKTGWYLHPKIPDTEDITPQINAFPLNLPSSESSSMESLSENNCSDPHTVDPESVEALRNELQLKLPLAQRVSEIHHNDHRNNEIDEAKTPPILMCKPSLRDDRLMNNKPGTNQYQGKNEVMIHYNMYGIVPLSPIQEESWSEFSEMEKAANKTDTSNSISLGEETSNIEQLLPFDGVCDMKVMELSCKDIPKDEDTYSDSSNRTFVLNDGGSCHLKRENSLSADSLNSIEQFEVYEENVECKTQKSPATEFLQIYPSNEIVSTLHEEHSHPKSSEEISQNVDNLLETISKTLESASKLSNINEYNDSHNLSNRNEMDLSENDNSGSKTYVIENKMDTVQNLKAIFNDKATEIPDDISSVSKVSQPSFVSDITSPDLTDHKSASVDMHTKTLSMESWCSNDTLFNVEEHFDDAYAAEFMSPINKVNVHENHSTCRDAPLLINKFDFPQIEMVMGCSENVDGLTLHQDNEILLAIHLSPPDNENVSKQVSGSLSLMQNDDQIKISLNENAIGDIEDKILMEDLKDIIPPVELQVDISCDCSDLPNLKHEIPCVVLEGSNVMQPLSHVSPCQDKQSNSTYISNFNIHGINMTSTPTTSLQEDKLNMDNVIDDHFKFLENLSCGHSSDSKSFLSISKVTSTFLQNEQKYAHSTIEKNISNSLNVTSPVMNLSECSDTNEILLANQSGNVCLEYGLGESGGVESVNSTSCSNIMLISKDISTIEDIPLSASNSSVDKPMCQQPTEEMNLDVAIQPEISQNIKEKILVDIDLEEAAKIISPKEDVKELKSLEEDSPSFEIFRQSAGILPQDLAQCTKSNTSNILKEISPGLRNIKFSGPSNEDDANRSMDDALSLPELSEEETKKLLQGHSEMMYMAPETLKDWESDDSNCSSASSTDFIYKEGEGEQLLNVPSISYPPAGGKRTPSSYGASQSFADIPEEDGERVEKGDDDDDEEEEMDFIPSSWDCHAAPSKSALKSPDTSQIETRKRVVFKKQKYQSIYEYPRDDEVFQTLPDFSTFADWNATNNDYVPVNCQHYLLSHSNQVPAMLGLGCEDDFYISSSSRPFETYSSINSSQFFPGQQFSLLSNQYNFGELMASNEDDSEDFKSLPPIPTDQELQLAMGNDIDLLTDPNDQTTKKGSDYVTPDSGTEDSSPGDFLNLENILNKKNLIVSKETTAEDEGVDDVDNICEKIVPVDEASVMPPANTTLGGLRHTRDRLKLDLPPSPLPNNSPCHISSGKNASKDARIFDFKNVDQFESDESCTSTPQNNESEEGKDKESDTCDSDVLSQSSVVSVVSKQAEDIKSVDVNRLDSSPPEEDPPTLHKSLVRMQDKSRRVSLEPVKGEGTLLDSGDEDSGIGSSAYATLERVHPQLTRIQNPSNNSA